MSDVDRTATRGVWGEQSKDRRYLERETVDRKDNERSVMATGTEVWSSWLVGLAAPTIVLRTKTPTPAPVSP